jgi:type I restriction enzyme M protein
MLVREELTDALIGLIPEDGSRISNGEIMAELEKLQEELEGLNARARELEAMIAANVAGILGDE